MLESVTQEVGAVMLTLASALLFEELTLGGLVKLIAAPKSVSRRNDKRPHGNNSGTPPA
jgi:hypothetical protein